MGHYQPLLVYFSSIQAILQNLIVDFSGIRSQIFKIEGKNANHLTTTKACSVFKHFFGFRLITKWVIRDCFCLGFFPNTI